MVRKLLAQRRLKNRRTCWGLKETVDWLATANRVRWYGHVLRRDDNSALRVALGLEVSGKRKRG